MSLGADPALNAMATEARQQFEAYQTDWQRFETEARAQDTEAAQALAAMKEEAAAGLPPEPPEVAQWRQMENTFDIPLEPGTKPRTSLGDEWLRNAGQELTNTAVEEVLEEGTEDLLKGAAKRLGQPASPRPGAQRQWFYEQEGAVSEPVPEADLLKLLEEGALPWSTLVWHRALQDWTPADETELPNLARPVTPPPLSPRKRKTGRQPAAQAPVCPACGKTGKVEDRFCPACGQPMAS